MSLILHKASYSKEPLRSIRSLCGMLGLNEHAVRDLTARSDSLYRLVPPKPGSKREIFDAQHELKAIHRRIKAQVFSQVHFPFYLTGSVRGRDYKLNASMHAGQRLVICEDVKGFFPSINAAMVLDVWRGFFGFSSEVARLLTLLTTKGGALPQGAIPSSFLANLVLWRSEPLLHAKLHARGITYSRYVDDIAMSAPRRLSSSEKTEAIAMVYGMLSGLGLRAGRAKHEVFSGASPMIVTKLVVNAKASLTKKQRSNVRSAMFQLEQALALGQPVPDAAATLTKLAQRIGQIGRFHKHEAAALRLRLQAARESVRSAVGDSEPTAPHGTATPAALAVHTLTPVLKPKP